MKPGPHAYDIDPNDAHRRMVEESLENVIHKLETEITHLKDEINKIYKMLDRLQNQVK